MLNISNYCCCLLKGRVIYEFSKKKIMVLSCSPSEIVTTKCVHRFLFSEFAMIWRGFCGVISALSPANKLVLGLARKKGTCCITKLLC